MLRTNLINRRKKNKLTQTEVAKMLGVTTRQYQALEAGTSDGSIKVWCKLKDLFHKPIDYLLEQVEETTSNAQKTTRRS